MGLIILLYSLLNNRLLEGIYSQLTTLYLDVPFWVVPVHPQSYSHTIPCHLALFPHEGSAECSQTCTCTRGKGKQAMLNIETKGVWYHNLSEGTISAALIWMIWEFHGSIHRSGFSYIHKLLPFYWIILHLWDVYTLNPDASSTQSGGRFVLNGFQWGLSFIPKSFNSARVYPEPTYIDKVLLRQS